MSSRPPLISEIDKYLKWEWENGLRYVDLPEFIPPQLPKREEAVPLPLVTAPREPVRLPKLTIPPDPEPAESGASGPEVVDNRAKAMARLRHEWANCQSCPLAATRHNFVFGEGNFTPRLLFVGEGPGENEDLQGRPFVGRAGELLTNLIKAMGLRREAVFITNIVKCRPPGNRDPAAEEVAACSPLLKKQIALLKPEVMVALGKPATHMLLNTTLPISKLRGTWQTYQDIPLMPTFHPAYLLRNPKDKGLIWADMCAVLQKLGLPVPDITRRTR